MSPGQNVACVVDISYPVRQGVLHGDRSLENTGLVCIYSPIAIDHVPILEGFALHSRAPSRCHPLVSQRCCIFFINNRVWYMFLWLLLYVPIVPRAIYLGNIGTTWLAVESLT